MKARVAELEAMLATATSQSSDPERSNAAKRGKIAEMTSEVVDSNPYSRSVLSLPFPIFDLF